MASSIGIYSTAVLTKVVNSLFENSRALTTFCFPGVIQSEEEKIAFDTVTKTRRIAPYVHPVVQGKVVEDQGYASTDFEPAYVKDKRVFDPSRPMKRMVGEPLMGSMSPMQRIQAQLNVSMQDQKDMLFRLLEVQASEILRTGSVTIAGDGFSTVVVNFGRIAGHTITLAGASRWGQAGIVPRTDLGTWTALMLQGAGAVVSDAIMDPAAYTLFTGVQDTKDILETRRGSVTEMEIVHMAKLGMSFKGTIDGINIWVYQEWYVNSAGSEVSNIPANTVILVSRQNIEGVQHYGAIRDEDANFAAVQMHSKSWVTEDPAVRYLLSQSAPLMVPYRVNATLCATVN